MGAVLLAGLLAAGAMLALSLPRVLPNADFAYMAIGTAMLHDRQLLVTPYFPPGYPLLLWLPVYFGASALTAGAIFSALGTGLTAGAVAATARLWAIPAIPALLLGLLTASLPGVVLIGLNPHLDALYTGLGAVLLAAAMHALARRADSGVWVVALTATILLLSLRWHALLLVMPVALVLALSRTGSRALGITLLITALLTSGALYRALYAETGSIRTAADVQVSAGAEYRRAGDETAATARMFDDYALWLQVRPAAGIGTVLEGIAVNWPLFLSAWAVLGGVGLWLLGLAVARREPPGAVWLALFIAGYTLALSPTYFTARAAALPSVAGVLLAAAGLSVLLFDAGGRERRGSGPRPMRRDGRSRRSASRGPLWTASAGLAVSLACIAGGWWNYSRLDPVLDALRHEHDAVLAVNRHAALVAGARRGIYGPFDRTGPGLGRLNLPAVTWSRLWLDDPAVATRISPYAPKLSPVEALADRNIRAVLVWPGEYPTARQVAELFESADWVELDSGVPGVRLWGRR